MHRHDLAVQTLVNHFVDKDYHLGETIIANTMVSWARYRVVGEHLFIRSEQLDSAYVHLDEPEVRDELHRLASAWYTRYWQYYRQIQEIVVERYPRPKQYEHEERTQAIKRGKEAMLVILKACALDEGLDYMAMVVVEWARRFNTEGFREYVERLKYTPVQNRDWETVTALWFMGMAFQIEG